LGALRDLFCANLFQLPDSFITITDEMARLLKEQGAIAPIHIVYNGVDTERFQPGDAGIACAELRLPLDKARIGMIGRLEFRQKQQHLLVHAVASDPQLTKSCHLVFAGDGPDAERLRSLLRDAGVSGDVLSWCDPARLYHALDALVIPSRYEGLPLVMLEALASGTAVLGSDRDGMRDILPGNWRFQPNGSAALAAALANFLAAPERRPPPHLVARVRSSMSLASFQDAFASAISALLPSN
jgi:glycosyltransferase involved in cell wall biosynthesis